MLWDLKTNWRTENLAETSTYPTVIATLGGKGTRLYPLTLVQSKPLIPIVNYPIFMRMLEVLARQGLSTFIFSTKGIKNTIYLKDVFRYAGGFSERLHLPQRVKFMYQPNYLDRGSADSIRYNMEYYNIKDEVLVVSGDNIAAINIDEMISFHREKNAIATIVVNEMPEGIDMSHFGVAELDGGDRIKCFVEKPKKNETSSRLINAAIYLFSPRILAVLKEMGDKAKDIGTDLIPHLIANDYPVYGFRFPGYWADVGTPDSFLRTSIDILNARVDHIKFRSEHEIKECVWIHPTTVARFKDEGPKIKKCTLVGGDCDISSSASIENSSIGDNCVIGSGVNIKNSVVMDFVNIEGNVRLNGCIVGRYASIGENAVIDADNIVEMAGRKDRTPVIGDGVHVFKDSVLGAYKRVARISTAYRILKTDRFIDLGYDNRNIYFTEK